MEAPTSFLAILALSDLPDELPTAIEGVLLPVFGETFDRDTRVTEGFAGAVGEERLRIVGVPEPVPEAVTEGPLRGAWYWPEGAAAFERAGAHLVVAVKGPESGKPTMRALFLTRVVSMLSRAFDALGVFWAGAPSVHSPEAFQASSDGMSPSELPLRLWVDFQVIRNDDDTHSLRTSGMESFGHYELEVHGSPKDQNEVASWAYNVAHYILAEGGEVEDGHAVGRNASEWIRVHHIPSVWNENRTVYYLDLEAER